MPTTLHEIQTAPSAGTAFQALPKAAGGGWPPLTVEADPVKIAEELVARLASLGRRLDPDLAIPMLDALCERGRALDEQALRAQHEMRGIQLASRLRDELAATSGERMKLANLVARFRDLGGVVEEIDIPGEGCPPAPSRPGFAPEILTNADSAA